MSLIQDALERTKHEQATRSAKSPVAPKPWQHDPMGTDLEQKLATVQRVYVRHRNLRRNLLIGFLAIVFVGAFIDVFYPKLQHHVLLLTSRWDKKPATVRVIFGGIYRLSGVMKYGGDMKAVINDEVVGAGEQLTEDIFVKEVQHNKVVLVARGKEIFIKF